MPNIEFNFEPASFWIGFLAATSFWWLVSRIRPLIPRWIEQIKRLLNVITRRNFASVEAYMQRETIRAAQRMHAAAPLFALEEVLIQPRLLLPPERHEPGAPEANPSATRRAIPYLPDWPELSAAFGVPTITPQEAAQSGQNLVIIGHPGSGKTVALAQIAMLAARETIQDGSQNAVIPIYLHACDLIFDQDEGKDPMQALVSSAAGRASVLMQPQITRFLNWVFASHRRKALLILDGLDELPPEAMKATVKYLERLVKKEPQLQVIAAGSIHYLDGLTEIGFTPLPVAAWGYRERSELLKKWGMLWNSKVLAETNPKNSVPAVEPIIMEYWLSGENAYANPLEWTLRLWGAYAGDLSGSEIPTALEAGLKRFLPDPAQWDALQAAAYAVIQAQSASLSYRQFEQAAGSAGREKGRLPLLPEPPAEPAVEGVENVVAQEGSRVEPKHGKRKSTPVSQVERMIAALVEAGILVEHSNQRLRFSSPLYVGFLSSGCLTPEEQAGLAQADSWSTAEAALQFAASKSVTLDWVYPLILETDPPLFRGLLSAARWLRDAPADAEWRFSLMRTMAGHIQNDRIPFGVRARMVAAFALSRDPSAVKLFKQLLTSRSTLVRRLALLGCGAAGSAQCIDDVLARLADPDPAARVTACMALAAIPEESAFNAVLQVMTTGDEDLRQAAAEALALHEGEGHQALKEAANEPDLLTRRAAVFGLLRVRAPWAKKLLEGIAVEDGQWIVRNAAAQALEALNENASLPAQPPTPSESPWLLAFASKFGMGILPGHPATDVLVRVLQAGSPEEQIAALYYLRNQPDQKVIGAIYDLLNQGPEEVKEHALHALWWMAISGVRLNAPEPATP